MKRNVGNIDRMIRIAFAVVVAVLYFTNMISGTVAIILGVAAGIFLFTGLSGWCAIYALTGLHTCKLKEPHA